MSRIVRFILTAALVAAFAGSAQAQRQRGQQQRGQQQPGQGQGMGMGFGGGSLRTMLATSKPLQDELKLTDDQIAKFKEYAEKNAPRGGGVAGPGGMGMGGGFGGGGFGGGAGSDADQIESLRAQIKTIEERMEFMNKTFTKEQAERFAQLETQRMGVQAFSSARIAKALNITDEQKKRIAEINTDLAKERRDMFGGMGGGRPDAEKLAEMQKKMTQLNEYAMEAIEKELTADQKSNWTKMVGVKFDMSKLQRRPTTDN